MRQGNTNKNELEPVKTVKEDKWHYKLREEFINYYTQFLQSQQFALVQLTAQPAKVYVFKNLFDFAVVFYIVLKMSPLN